MAAAIPEPNLKKADPWGRPYTTATLPADFNWEDYDKNNAELRTHWDANPQIQAVYGGNYQQWMEDDLYENMGSLERRWPTIPPRAAGDLLGKHTPVGQVPYPKGTGPRIGQNEFPPKPKIDDDGGDDDGGGDNGVGQNWSQYEANIGALLGGFRNPIGNDSLNLARNQIQYANRRLTEIEQARKLGDMTGTLTSAEIKLFDEMETSAVDNLKSQVNAQTEGVWNTALSDLVNRGILQGTVGQKILGTISSENVRTIAEGANAIRGQTNTGKLNVMEGNKNRAVQLEQMRTQEALGLMGIGQGYANADLQSELTKLGLGVNANLQMAGLSSTEGMSEENRALQLALGNLQAQTAGAGFANAWKIANLQAVTQSNIAGLQSGTQLKLGGLDAQTKLALAALYGSAANTSSLYGLGGNALTAILGGLSKTDWWKNLGQAGSSFSGGGGGDDQYSWYGAGSGYGTGNPYYTPSEINL